MNFFDWVIRLPESYKNRIKEVIKKIEEELKMEYIPLWERDARREGERIGEKRGEKRVKRETAKQMLLDNVPIEKVVKYTGLTEKEVKALMH
jgi:predicted transposase/invertase (TIGR01784 family)